MGTNVFKYYLISLKTCPYRNIVNLILRHPSRRNRQLSLNLRLSTGSQLRLSRSRCGTENPYFKNLSECCYGQAVHIYTFVQEYWVLPYGNNLRVRSVDEPAYVAIYAATAPAGFYRFACYLTVNLLAYAIWNFHSQGRT